MLGPGSEGTSNPLWGERNTESFTEEGGPRSPHGTVPALLGTQPLDQDLGVQLPEK